MRTYKMLQVRLLKKINLLVIQKSFKRLWINNKNLYIVSAGLRHLLKEKSKFKRPIKYNLTFLRK